MIWGEGHHLNGEQPDTFDDYRDQQHRTTLYRVLANNLIRELRRSGYHGTSLLGFASEVMEAITANGWDAHEDRGAAAETPGPLQPPGSDGDVEPERFRGPAITGRRVVLRPPLPQDRPVLQSWLNDPLVRDSLIPAVIQYVIEHCDESDARRVDRIVCLPGSEAPIGLVSLHDLDPVTRMAELGKVIGDPAQRGQGLAQEAARLIVAYGFRILNLNRVYLRTFGGNLKNIRINERIGFRFEGVQRQAAMCHGELTDVILMGLLREEFDSRSL